MAGKDLYLIRDFVPDFDAIAAEFAARSREFSARARMCTDIAYGARPRETLDIIMPDDAVKDAPLHVFVHGGYWRSGEKADYRFVASPVLAAGGIAALVEYDLMPGQRLPVLVDQVRRAVLWLQEHAASFGADPSRISVSGHSAGAHLASYLAASAPGEAGAAVLPALKDMLLLSGIYDLSGIPDSFLRHEAEMTHAEAAAWSPLASTHHAGPRRTLTYGTDETAPFHEQAQSLHAKLGDEGLETELLPLPALNHMSVVLDLGNVDGRLGRRIADMVAAD
ncbi:alpha/beta hydrolase [Mesorhizobium xinjiangense]|uniref:alpha/beta hydrolase n=1 Tax=Mesorhizobium xinjiangense TaxID=2678685 RepID=UPI0012EEC979|nr:alpha/beta hydrolase [Mesorhizobium xinjiangense]